MKTASQVQDILARHGATEVSIRYRDGKPIAVAFGIETSYGPRAYRLPVNTEGVFKAVKKYGSGVPPRYQNQNQAARIAWRILKDWTEAQLAMIESGMENLDTVMLPYMVINDAGETLAQLYVASAGLRQAIEAGERSA